MKKIKILHFSQVLGGGVERYIKMYLKHSNFENSVLLPKNVDSDYYSKVVSIFNIDITQSFSPIKVLKYVLAVRQVFKLNDPDVIYLHSTFAGVIGRLAALGLRAKVIYNPHGWSFKMNVSKLNKIIYKLIEYCFSIITDKLILISKSEYNEALKIGIKKNKLELVYNGVETNLNKIYENNQIKFDGKYIIGMVGRLCEQKNPLFFVEFANRIFQDYPNSFFIIVGDGEMRDIVEKRVLEYGLRDNFLITGWVEDPEKYIKSFDQAVLFSNWEGFSLAIMEYMLYKKPIIINNNIDDMSELIEDSITGFSIRKNDLNMAVEKSNILRSNSELVKSFGEKAHRKVLEKFSISDTVKKIENLCIELVERKK